MEGDAQLAARYLKRAVEVRAIAETIKDEKANKVLIEVAADYEQMARALNEMTRAGKPIRLPTDLKPLGDTR
jgi:hypothetical protein